MNVDTVYPSKYMKAADLPEESLTPFTIEEVKVEEIGQNKDKKIVLYFRDHGQGFVVNKTNKNTIKRVLASGESEDWVGKTIKLYRTEVQFGDEMVESIRVSLKSGKNGTQSPDDYAAHPDPEF